MSKFPDSQFFKFSDFQILKFPNLDFFKELSFGNIEDKTIKVFCEALGTNGRF